MITLIQYPPAFGLPNPSAFCVKAEVFLKMADLDYNIKTVADPSKGPKGKLPAIEDSGKIIGDSALIRKHLETTYSVDFDKGLSDKDKAIAHAFEIMLAERTYWAIVYNRWIDERNWPTIRDTFFGGMPPIVRNIVPGLIQKKVKKSLAGHGLGRHTSAEIDAFAIDDARACAAWLGDKDYFMGDKPVGVDASVYAFLGSCAMTSFESALTDEIKSHDNLKAYIDRCHTLWFG